jgi:hypothetical protein
VILEMNKAVVILEMNKAVAMILNFVMIMMKTALFGIVKITKMVMER